MEIQEGNSVLQDAVASTHVSVEIPENLEADAEKRIDLLERSAILEMEDNEAFTPDDDRKDSDARGDLEKNVYQPQFDLYESISIQIFLDCRGFVCICVQESNNMCPRLSPLPISPNTPS